MRLKVYCERTYSTEFMIGRSGNGEKGMSLSAYGGVPGEQYKTYIPANASVLK